jgi:hypothetical protein
LNLFDEVCRSCADAVDDAAWLIFDLDGRKLLFFLYFCRSLKIWLAKIAFRILGLVGCFGWRSFGRQTCGDIFVAFNFVRVALVKNFFLRRRAANGFGASLCGIAIRPLLLAVSQAAAGAETHSAPATPGKISVTHN